MSLSYDIPGITGLSGVDVTVKALDQTKLVHKRQIQNQDGSYTDLYQMSTSDPAYPITVEVRVSPAKNRLRTFQITLKTWATITESITGAVIYRQIRKWNGIELPADVTIEVADLAVLYMADFALTYKSVTTKVPDTVVVADALSEVSAVW